MFQRISLWDLSKVLQGLISLITWCLAFGAFGGESGWALLTEVMERSLTNPEKVAGKVLVHTQHTPTNSLRVFCSVFFTFSFCVFEGYRLDRWLSEGQQKQVLCLFV